MLAVSVFSTHTKNILHLHMEITSLMNSNMPVNDYEIDATWDPCLRMTVKSEVSKKFKLSIKEGQQK